MKNVWVCVLVGVLCCGCGNKKADPTNNTNNENNTNNGNNGTNQNNTNNRNNSNNSNNSNNRECSDGDRRLTTVSCGFNDRGVVEEACVGGLWQTGDCQDPDECTNNEERSGGPCGLFGTGEQFEQCINGLWSESVCSDPTTVELVKDLNPLGDGNPLMVENEPSFSQGQTIVGTFDDRIIFFGEDNDGRAMFVTDGTTAGTNSIADFGTVQRPFISSVTEVVGGYVFSHGINVWFSDGTVAGTSIVFTGDIRNANNQWVFDGVNFGLFYVEDGVGDRIVYQTDGTLAGTIENSNLGNQGFMTDVRAGLQQAYITTSATGNHFISCFDGTNGITVNRIDPSRLEGVEVGGVFYFRSSDFGTSDQELWRTDCTLAGTQLVADISPNGESAPRSFHAIGNSIVFFAYPDRPTTTDEQLFVTDGTALGTSSLTPTLTNVDEMWVAGNRAYFSGRNTNANQGYEPWVSDGTLAGTMQLGDLNPGPSNGTRFTKFIEFGSFVYFTGSTPEGILLFRTDGTPAGTEPVTMTTLSEPNGFDIAGDRIVFAADDGQTGREVWVTDGTPFSEQRVTDINPDGHSVQSFYHGVVNLPNTVLFAADDGLNGTELWAIRY